MLLNLVLYCCGGEAENASLEIQHRWKPAHEGLSEKKKKNSHEPLN